MMAPLRACVSARILLLKRREQHGSRNSISRLVVLYASFTSPISSPLPTFPSRSPLLSKPTAPSLPDVVADSRGPRVFVIVIRRTTLSQSSHNRMQHYARKPLLAACLTMVAQGCLRGSFQLCWPRRRSVQQIALHGCKRCSGERWVLRSC